MDASNNNLPHLERKVAAPAGGKVSEALPPFLAHFLRAANVDEADAYTVIEAHADELRRISEYGARP